MIYRKERKGNMRRLVILLAVMVVALVLAGGTVFAESGEGNVAGSETKAFTASPLEGDAGQRLSAAAAAAPEWQMSRESNTGYRHVFTGQWTPLTGERVGYWGASDASYPRAGDLYYGGAEIFNYGNPTSANGITTANFEVKLPSNTRFDVNPNILKQKIRCYWFRPSNNTSGEFTGARFQGNGCPIRPTSGGIHGTRFLPPTNNGTWRIPAGYGISVTFPIVSTAPLKGYANIPAPACIIGSVWAAGGGTPDGRVWDAPTAGERCPLPQYHGTDRPVIVSPNTAPRISAVRPVPGSKTRDTTPRISATVTDRETDLAKRNIRLYVDGKQKTTFSYNRSTNKLNYLSRKLSYARHTAKIVVRDAQGRTTSKSWGFTVVR